MLRKIGVFFIILMVIAVSSSLVFALGNHVFKAKLTGKEQVPMVKTAAKGEATFKVSKDGKEIMYKLIVKNIVDVTAAHIHEGSMGKNGGPVANLFIGPKKEGKFSGTLAEGTITEKDLIGSLSGKSISDLIDMIKTGNAYVNVHTDNHPDGEIRGQIK
jgi:hypothetical protein